MLPYGNKLFCVLFLWTEHFLHRKWKFFVILVALRHNITHHVLPQAIIQLSIQKWTYNPQASQSEINDFLKDFRRFLCQTLGEFRRLHGKNLGDLWSFEEKNRRITTILIEFLSYCVLRKHNMTEFNVTKIN